MMVIYKIMSRDEWSAARADGRFEGSPVDLDDGFLHFSTAAQAGRTAAKHFTGRDDLVLVAVEADRLGEALKWEPAREDELFPHLYAPLDLAAVAWVAPLPLDNGRHVFPEAVR